LRDGDEILAIDGSPIDSADMLDRMATRLLPDQQAQLKVRRNDEERTLTVKGLEPQQEAVLYYDWQLAFAGSCIVFLILIIATQPLSPLAALWRPILLILSGLAGTATLLFYNWRGDTELLSRRWPVDNLPFPWVQLAVCVAMAVGLAALGTWEIRGIVAYCQRPAGSDRTTGEVDLAQLGAPADQPRDGVFTARNPDPRP
jgi:hypothetical protein